MRGYILLEGGAEFGGQMAKPDKRAIELAGGSDVQVSIVPTAAFPDKNHQRAGQSGVRWFERLGARHVTLLPLIDQASANQFSVASALRQSRLIYLLGGFPHYLAQTLAGSLSWQAMLEAYDTGAVIGGSSAGAMILCESTTTIRTHKGLGKDSTWFPGSVLFLIIIPLEKVGYLLWRHLSRTT